MLPQRWRLEASLFATLAIVSAAHIDAQLIAVDKQQCVWRAGDDVNWAQPNLDETEWQPYSAWSLNPAEPHVWIRCHTNLSVVRNAEQPGVQVRVFAAYQVFANGQLMGSVGDLKSGRFDMNTVHDFPLSADVASPMVIALRTTWRIDSMVPVGALPPLRIDAGDRTLLVDRRNSLAFEQIRQRLVPTVCFSVIGIVGLILMGLWLNDRSRKELLLLFIACLTLSFIYLDYFFPAALLAYPVSAYFLGWGVSALVNNLARTLFFFALARKRVPLLFWVLVILSVVPYTATLIVPFLAPAQALWLDELRSHQIEALADIARGFESLAPFLVFLPWKNLTQRMKPLAVLCMTWGLTMTIFFIVRLTGTRVPGIPNLEAHWGAAVSDAEAIVTLGVLIALFALLFREQQQTANERAVLAGEMHAAQQVQRMLAPAILDTVPGVRVEAVFRPIREVGGDFYSCRRLPADRQRILIGDVSGKGAAAAMTAAVLIGAAQRRDEESPAELLRHLNLVMVDMQVSGFATCLCVEISADGVLTLANAGHLAPYRDGKEIPVESGLPLGISPDSKYGETAFALSAADTLTFLSDGVVEARNHTGELFGFDRAQAISTQSAESIAHAAQAFGQEDDITVLTLKFAPASAILTVN